MSVGLSFELDASNDLVINTDANGNKTPALIEGLFEAQQAIKLRILQQRGFDIYHPLDGLPTDTLVGPVSPEYVLSVIIREIKKDRRVADVRSGDVNFDSLTRILSISLNVVFKDGSEVNVSTDLGLDIGA